jgi:KDO2-lipid IV(A) lauroyltransferase
MNNIKYFLQFLLIIPLFLFFKLIGLNIASFLGGKLFEAIGPLFRSKKVIHSNIKKAFPKINSSNTEKITKEMWNNYGRVFAEYMFIKNYRNNLFNSHINIKGEEILREIKENKKPVIFISGHLSNFELMAMTIEKLGIKLAAIYRPLNNQFLNILMERIRKKYICKYQIKKGISGLREIIKLNKSGFSTALMIDQRVSQGIKSNFFNQEAFTTTIPAQLVKKYDYPIVPLFIERIEGIKFRITIHKPIYFSKNNSEKEITEKLNNILEKMILIKPGQWIWSHNRWKK